MSIARLRSRAADRLRQSGKPNIETEYSTCVLGMDRWADPLNPSGAQVRPLRQRVALSLVRRRYARTQMGHPLDPGTICRTVRRRIDRVGNLWMRHAP